ncbi:hypothetical protein EBZ38_02325 [bacterium]|nr:hypothetical protein [bacterium]NDD83108.1 hypothetical protein [bacterium]
MASSSHGCSHVSQIVTSLFVIVGVGVGVGVISHGSDSHSQITGGGVHVEQIGGIVMSRDGTVVVGVVVGVGVHV